MTVVVVATIYPLAEHRVEVLDALSAAIARVHAEDAGCELYALHEGDDRLVMLEKWASAQALAAHSKAAALEELNGRLDGKLTRPTEVRILQPYPAGTAHQGTL